MFGWDFEADAWSRFWRWNLIEICFWTCDKNSTLRSVVPLAMFSYNICPHFVILFKSSMPRSCSRLQFVITSKLLKLMLMHSLAINAEMWKVKMDVAVKLSWWWSKMVDIGRWGSFSILAQIPIFALVQNLDVSNLKKTWQKMCLFHSNLQALQVRSRHQLNPIRTGLCERI